MGHVYLFKSRLGSGDLDVAFRIERLERIADAGRESLGIGDQPGYFEDYDSRGRRVAFQSACLPP